MKMNEILTKSCIFGPLRIDYQRAGWFGMEAAHRLEMEPVCPSVLVDGFNLSELGLENLENMGVSPNLVPQN